jgi:hypothetical protein
MVVSIDGIHYSVSPLAPAPGASKAYRFNKLSGDEAQHDLDETADGASCTCGSFVWRHDGLDDLGCKHIRAARHLGLIAEAPERDDDARAAYDDAREAEALAANPARDIVLLDDDGTPLETPAEMDARHRAEHAAKVAELMTDNPFLPACCPDDEVLPCTACVAHEGPADLSDDGWDDSFVWAPTADDGRMTIATDDGHSEPGPRSLAEQVDDHARELRAQGSPLGDLLAERAESLAAQIRLVDASTVSQFRDRLDCLLDAEAARVEARHAARCC